MSSQLPSRHVVQEHSGYVEQGTHEDFPGGVQQGQRRSGITLVFAVWTVSSLLTNSLLQARGIARPSVLSRAFVDDAGSYLDDVLLRCAPQLFTGMNFISSRVTDPEVISMLKAHPILYVSTQLLTLCTVTHRAN